MRHYTTFYTHMKCKPQENRSRLMRSLEASSSSLNISTISAINARNIILLFVAVAVSASLLTTHQFASAALPSTISTGYYECIGSGGGGGSGAVVDDCSNIATTSRLQLRDMMLSAQTAGNSSVTFTLANHVFNGGFILIECPDFASDFILPVHILIQNGSCSRTGQDTYDLIQITGRLISAKSTIIIEGGRYDYVVNVITMSFLRIDNDPSFDITGGSVISVRNIETNRGKFIKTNTSGASIVSEGSTIELLNCTYIISTLESKFMFFS